MINKFYKIFSTVLKSKQIGSRRDRFLKIFDILRVHFLITFLKKEIIYEWVNGSKFFLKKGQYSLTGNVYYKYYEYEPMYFLLINLTSNDVLLDIGANLGSFSILALSKNSKVISIEPDDKTYLGLIRNLELNADNSKYQTFKACISENIGETMFTKGLGEENKIIEQKENHKYEIIRTESLDSMNFKFKPTYLKIDVEGHELSVLKGALNFFKKYNIKGIIIETSNLIVHEMLISLGFKLVELKKGIFVESKNFKKGTLIYNKF